MIPSLECEVQADLVTDLTFIHQEEYKFDGPVSLDLQEELSGRMRRCQNLRHSQVILAMESDICFSPPGTAFVRNSDMNLSDYARNIL